MFFSSFSIEDFEGETLLYLDNRPLFGTTLNSVQNYLGINFLEIIEDVNKLLVRYEIKFPHNFPEEIQRDHTFYLNTQKKIFRRKNERNLLIQKYSGKYFNTIATLLLLLGISLKLEKLGINAKKLIKEMIADNSPRAIHHSCSIALISHYYLQNFRDKYEIELFPKTDYGSEPDLLIKENQTNYYCDVKTFEGGSFIMNLETGKTPRRHYLYSDMCYDIGHFISNSSLGCKGIKQADVIFADFSMRDVWNGMDKKLNKFNYIKGLPESIEKNSIIFFARDFYNLKGLRSFYMKFQDDLWIAIKESALNKSENQIHRRIPSIDMYGNFYMEKISINSVIDQILLIFKDVRVVFSNLEGVMRRMKRVRDKRYTLEIINEFQKKINDLKSLCESL